MVFVFPFSISRTVSNLVAIKLRELQETQLLDHWRDLARLPDERAITGAVFEAYVYRKFCQHIKISAIPILKSGNYHATTIGHNDTTATPLLNLAKTRRQFVPTNAKSLELNISCDETVVYDAQINGKIMVQNDVFYQPQTDQPVGFDAFVVHSNSLYLFKFTGGKARDIQDGILTSLDNHFDGLPPAPNRNFIFVIPSYLIEFSCPDSSRSFGLNLYTASIQME
ncbi:hypothetical protein CPB83DRAFT_399733 [Crepidotus variabilis]|uniref:Uncharacterized protein n=1 Tax=Crepidotus variabilis TaxID=179855 RepID=A0A9P6EDZ1_9AGAR|nr:hypothetical protein CPB83DRAFT_399733 [Crepidotus variabilis]